MAQNLRSLKKWNTSCKHLYILLIAILLGNEELAKTQMDFCDIFTLKVPISTK